MKSQADLALDGGGGGGSGGQMEKRLTLALNLAAFLHIIVSPYTKVNPLYKTVLSYYNILCSNFAFRKFNNFLLDVDTVVKDKNMI